MISVHMVDADISVSFGIREVMKSFMITFVLGRQKRNESESAKCVGINFDVHREKETMEVVSLYLAYAGL